MLFLENGTDGKNKTNNHMRGTKTCFCGIWKYLSSLSMAKGE